MPIKWVKCLKYLFFRIFRIFTTFSNFPFYMEFWVFKWRLSMTRGVVFCLTRLHLPPLKCQFSIPYILGWKLDILESQIAILVRENHFEGDPTISTIGNVPLQNIQRMGPHPKPLWIRHPIIYISRTDSKLQSTLLHQRFICYWHIELVDVVEIYIAPTFHIILQSL